MEQISNSLPESQRFPWYAYLWRMIRHPLKSGREIATWKKAWAGFAVVLVFSLYLAQGNFRSYLNHDYPPPPDEFSIWIETWGAFAMLPMPFLRIPLEQYRLFMAAISLPVVIGSWLYMAAAAHLLTRWFGGKTGFQQYLNLLAFSFFPFWFAASLGDWAYSAALGPYVLPGLRGEYGPLLQAFFVNFPPWLYTILFGLAAI